MNKMNKIGLLILAITLGATFGLHAQKRMVLIEKGSEIIISGSSNVHDWDMKVVKIKGSLDLSPDIETHKSFDKIDVSLNPKNIKSHSSIMDNKTYAALKANKYPSIGFNMTSINNLKINGASFSAEIVGVLKVAGKSKKVILNSVGIFNSDNSLTTTGILDMKMTDFGINPPTAMMGAMKTGDDIRIKFNLTFGPDLNTLTNK